MLKKVDYLLTSRLYWLVAMAVLVSACDTERIYIELRTSSGGSIQVLIVSHDDPGLTVEGVGIDGSGKRLPQEVFIGSADDISLSRTRFNLYQAKGGDLVGLYRESEPGVVLMVVDFEENWVLGPLTSAKFKEPELSKKKLKQLAGVAGIELRYSESYISNWGAG